MIISQDCKQTEVYILVTHLTLIYPLDISYPSSIAYIKEKKKKITWFNQGEIFLLTKNVLGWYDSSFMSSQIQN